MQNEYRQTAWTSPSYNGNMSFLPYPPPPEPGWYDDDVTVMAQPTAEPVDNAADSLETRERLAAQNESGDHDMQDVSVAKGDAAVSDEDDIDWDGTVLSEAFTMKQPKHTYVLDNEQTGQQVIVDMGVTITPQIANCLYTGISTDTGCFRYASATAESYRIAADLIEAGADNGRINRVMFETKTKTYARLERLALESMRFYLDERVAIITVTQEMYHLTGSNEQETEGLAPLTRQIEGVEVGITIREKPDGTCKASLRTFESVNAAEIAKAFGGGGHPQAAACNLDMDVKTARAKLVEKCGELLV